LRPRKWCIEPSRLGPVGRCWRSGGHRVILIEKASSERSHHDGHHLLLWTSSPSCASTWPRLTRICCARCSRPSPRRSWVPRSMRSAALPTTMRAPSAPIGATGIGNGPGIHGWARSNLASASSARAPTSQTGSQSAVVALVVALTSCSPPARVLGVSRRRLEKLAWALGITKRSKSQISHDGPQPGRRGPSLSHPSPGYRPLPDRLGGCPGGQGARGRWDRERPRARRHWSQCARAT